MNSQMGRFELDCFHRAIEVDRIRVITKHHFDLSAAPCVLVKPLYVIIHLKSLLETSWWCRTNFFGGYSFLNYPFLSKLCTVVLNCYLLYSIQINHFCWIPYSISSVITRCNLHICPDFKESWKPVFFSLWKCRLSNISLFFSACENVYIN